MPKFDKEYFKLISASTIGLEMGISVAIGFYVGLKLDQHAEVYINRWFGTNFDSGNTFTVLFTLFGLGAALKAVVNVVIKTRKSLKEPDGKDNDVDSAKDK